VLPAGGCRESTFCDVVGQTLDQMFIAMDQRLMRGCDSSAHLAAENEPLRSFVRQSQFGGLPQFFRIAEADGGTGSTDVVMRWRVDCLMGLENHDPWGLVELGKATGTICCSK
jgi:hypothetical protein